MGGLRIVVDSQGVIWWLHAVKTDCTEHAAKKQTTLILLWPLTVSAASHLRKIGRRIY